MSTASESHLQPVVTALRPEAQLLVPFTDYSRWERKHTKSSTAAQVHKRTGTLSPLSTTRLRKTSKSTAPEAKKLSTPGAKVRLQPLAVCSHGQGIRRKHPTVNISDSTQVVVNGGRRVKVAEKQLKSSRLGRFHEPTSIRLLRVSLIIVNLHRHDSHSLLYFQLQLAARKSSVSEYSRYRDQLLMDNLSIISSIQHTEEQTVNLLLLSSFFFF